MNAHYQTIDSYSPAHEELWNKRIPDVDVLLDFDFLPEDSWAGRSDKIDHELATTFQNEIPFGVDRQYHASFRRGFLLHYVQNIFDTRVAGYHETLIRKVTYNLLYAPYWK